MEDFELHKNSEWRHHIHDDIGLKMDERYKHLDGNYVLIASICNEKSKEEKVSVNDEYMHDVMEDLNVNMRGDGE